MTSTPLLLLVLLHCHYFQLISSAKLAWIDNPDILSEVVEVDVRKSRSVNLDEEEFFEINYRAFDENINVRVSRSTEEAEDSSVFGRNYKASSLGVDRHGNPKLTDNTPTREEVLETEKNVYVDPETNTAVRIKEGANGQVKLDGIIKGRTIVSKKSKLKGLLDGNGTHTISQEKIPKMPDFVDLHRKTKPLRGRALFQGIPLIEPEVFVLLDYDNTMLHNDDLKTIMDYLVVLFKSVNNRFATLKDKMLIKFKISGLITIRFPGTQTFIENNAILNGKGYDIVKILEDFSKWCYQNQQVVPAHDLAALITGKNMYTLDANGRYNEGVTGYAYVKGACWVNDQERKYMGTSVTEDIGGYWYGVFSVAHEFAHNLGAPHDGQQGGGPNREPSTADCPWNQGYMMSYDGWGKKNKFYFSPCSGKMLYKCQHS